MKLTTNKRRRFRVGKKLKSVANKDRFRLSISRSSKNISAQIIDDSKNITLLNKIDVNIVGGFILRVGDLQYDASFKNQLNKLKQDFINITIQ